MRGFLVLLLLPLAAFAEAAPKLTLVIHHLYAGQPREFATPTLATESGERISITRLAYLPSEPAVKEAGTERWLASADWFAFVDRRRAAVPKYLAACHPAR